MIAEATGATAGAIANAAQALQLPLAPLQVEQLAAYVSLLERWNRTYNLTSVREPAAIVDRHVADCLATVAPLRRQLGDQLSPRLLDVGSGGGLPGLVLAIANPGWLVTCIDAVAKKAAFVRQAAAELGLGDVDVVHGRVERLETPPAFDVVTARAFSSLSAFAESSAHLLADGGVWMAMKAKSPDAEIAQLSPEVAVFHVEPVDVPALNEDRCLVWMRLTQTASAR